MNNVGTSPIRTQRLELRRLKVSDAGAVFSWAGNEENTKYMSFKTHSSIADAQKFLRAVKYTRKTFEWGISLDGKLIGSIGAYRRGAYSAEVGYILHRDYWGKGYTTEALKAVVHYLIADAGFNRVFACHHPGNPASGRVQVKAGMKYEGVMRGHAKFKGKEFADTPLYAITAEDIFGHARPLPENELQTGHSLFSGGAGDLSYSYVSAEKEPDNEVDYNYDINLNGKKIGHLRLTFGSSRSLYYLGQVGYTIEEKYRGNGYAQKAVRMIMPAAYAAGFERFIITCNPGNAASVKTIENLGGELIRIADIPKGHYLYKQGERVKRVYEVRVMKND